jgi:hypothetical protein
MNVEVITNACSGAGHDAEAPHDCPNRRSDNKAMQ